MSTLQFYKSCKNVYTETIEDFILCKILSNKILLNIYQDKLFKYFFLLQVVSASTKKKTSLNVLSITYFLLLST